MAIAHIENNLKCIELKKKSVALFLEHVPTLLSLVKKTVATSSVWRSANT